MERETGFEPATSTLARSHSTTELFPHSAEVVIVPQPRSRDNPCGQDAPRVLDWPLSVWYDAVFPDQRERSPSGAVAKW